MALNPCVKRIICPLGDAFIGAVNALITLFLAQIDAQIAAAQAALAVVEIQLTPIRVAAAAAQTVLNQARAASDIIPAGLAGDCLSLGEFVVDIRKTIETTIADIADFSRELQQMFSFQDELQALVDELNAIRDRYGDFQLELQACS